VTNPVLVEVTRGGAVESRHRAAAVVVDASGRTVLSVGEVDVPVFPRSAVKALQALPLIESGAADRYGLTDAELALACASHSGEPAHVATAAGMLAKAGLDAACLECGAHWPSGEAAGRALAGQAPTPLHNNCSGKHAGFLCLACHEGVDPAGYVRAGHPIQERVRASLEEATGVAHGEANRGTDGCSIPTYAVPLTALARAFARFGTGEGMGPGRAEAAARLRRAAAAYPDMVAGTGRFDTRIMGALGERAFTKTGAEGVYCAALPEVGLGIAVKCDDGAGRAAEAVVAVLIGRYLPLSGAQADAVEAAARPTLRNWNGIEVGAVRPVGPLAG
jgi:L-asparaginase II